MFNPRLALATLVAATVAAPLANADTEAGLSRVEPSQANTSELWTARPLSFNLVGLTGEQSLGTLAALDVDYAPLPWLYVSAFAGHGYDNVAAGGGVHLRRIQGNKAVSLGVGMLHTGAHMSETTDSEFLGPTLTTDVSFAATSWFTSEVALEYRDTAGITYKLVGGIDSALAGGAYTCMKTDYDNGLFGSGNATTTSCGSGAATAAPYVGFSLGFSPKL